MSRLIESGTTDGVGFGNADETDAPLNVAGEFNVAGTLNLDQALGISGVVLDDSQAPIQDATIGVTLTENGGDVIYETTDVNGEYAFTEHPDGDSTKQEWHVTAALNDAGDLFNAESKPFVRATLTPTIIQATGGDVVQDVTLNGVDYRIHAFTTVGSQIFEVTDAPSQNDTVDVLLVGGGGPGGTNDSGSSLGGAGGGAGGVIFNQNAQVTENTYPIVVGDGGTGPSGNSADRGPNGDDTTALGLTALGGGAGGCRGGQAGGADGGSGGGISTTSNEQPGVGLQPASVDGGFGNDGGAKAGKDWAQTGGGGAGAPGEDGFAERAATDGGQGGDFSTEFGIGFGENGIFGGGGGGGQTDQSESSSGIGVGGVGGGGDGGSWPDNGAGNNGMTNTGGGGGGAAAHDGSNYGDVPGGDGGSGVVLIRYEI